MDAAAELGRNPVGKHRIQPEYGEEHAGAGWDCLTRLARPNSLNSELLIFPVLQLTTSRIGNLTRLIHTLDICVTINVFISKTTFFKAPLCRNNEKCTEVHDGGGLELVKPAREQASTRP